jgi:hypothetical protein
MFAPVPGLPPPSERVPEYDKERVLDQASRFVDCSIDSAIKAVWEAVSRDSGHRHRRERRRHVMGVRGQNVLDLMSFY